LRLPTDSVNICHNSSQDQTQMITGTAAAQPTPPLPPASTTPSTHDQDDLSSLTHGFTPGLSRYARAETRISRRLGAQAAHQRGRRARAAHQRGRRARQEPADGEREATDMTASGMHGA